MEKSFSSGFVTGLLLMLIVGGGVGYTVYYYYLDDLFQDMMVTTGVQGEVDSYIEKKTNPLYYSVDDSSISVEKTELVTSQLFTAESLESMAEECGSEVATDANYWTDIADIFSGANQNTSYEYAFTYKGGSQDPKSYYVTAVPNAQGWTTMKEFTDNMNICAAGGKFYPKTMNDQWLVFGSSCGSGYNDGSDKPIGCALVGEALNMPGSLELR